MNGAHRYFLHPTIADYACLQLEHSGHFDEAHTRLITYFTAFVEKHSADYEIFERESSNILAALEAAFTLDGITELPRLACAFTPFLLSRGLFALAEQHLLRAYEAATFAHDITGHMHVLATLENVRQKRGRCSERLLEGLPPDGASPETSARRTINTGSREALRSHRDL